MRRAKRKSDGWREAYRLNREANESGWPANRWYACRNGDFLVSIPLRYCLQMRKALGLDAPTVGASGT
jgi:hypothetical protein